MPDTSNTSATRATRMRYECNSSDASKARATRGDTSATRVLHERTSATRVLDELYESDASENFDFGTGTSKNIFLHSYIYYMASERLQGEEQFHSKNYLLEMPYFHARMHLKSAPQKLDFLMTKARSKSCTLDCSCKCPCTFPHSYAQ